MKYICQYVIQASTLVLLQILPHLNFFSASATGLKNNLILDKEVYHDFIPEI